MHKLIEKMKEQLNVEAEQATEKLTQGNLDAIFKLTCAIKNLERMERGEKHDAESERMERRADARFDRNINELYDKYLWCKKEYARDGSAVHKEKVTESLERLMSEICDLLFDIHHDCDFREEREIVDKHVKSMDKIS